MKNKLILTTILIIINIASFYFISNFNTNEKKLNNILIYKNYQSKINSYSKNKNNEINTIEKYTNKISNEINYISNNYLIKNIKYENNKLKIEFKSKENYE
jgi:hypothetical protein